MYANVSVLFRNSMCIFQGQVTFDKDGNRLGQTYIQQNLRKLLCNKFGTLIFVFLISTFKGFLMFENFKKLHFFGNDCYSPKLIDSSKYKVLKKQLSRDDAPECKLGIVTLNFTTYNIPFVVFVAILLFIIDRKRF